MTPADATAYQATLGLRAVRNFEARPVSEEHLAQILQAARWTGSSKNIQPWIFVVVTDPVQRDAVAAAGSFTAPVTNAPLTIAIVRTPDGGDFDMGRAAQNIMLAAQAIGVASCPVTLHNEAVARQALGLPDDHGCRYAIALGYADVAADVEAAKSRPYGGRKPLEELVRYQRF